MARRSAKRSLNIPEPTSLHSQARSKREGDQAVLVSVFEIQRTAMSILKSDGCPTPRSGVRAVAQGASPGIDFRDKTSREAAAELQILPPLRGWDVHAHAHPALARWAMFSRRFA